MMKPSLFLTLVAVFFMATIKGLAKPQIDKEVDPITKLTLRNPQNGGSGVLWTNIPCSADSDLAGLVTPIFFENGEVTISIPLKRSVCIQFAGNQLFPKSKIILCPGDHLILTADNSSGKWSFGATGDNASGNLYLLDSTLFAGYRWLNEYLTILRTGKGKAELIDQVDSMLDMELESFLSMEKQGDISDAFLSAVKAEMQQMVLYAAGLAVRNIEETNRLRQKAKELYFYYLERYSPLAEMYKGSEMSLHNAGTATLRGHKNLAGGKRIDIGLWDGSKEFFHEYCYLPDDVQIRLFISKIQLLHFVVGAITTPQYVEKVALLGKVVGSSRYLELLRSFIDLNDPSGKNYSRGLFFYDHKFDKLEELGKEVGENLPEVIKRFFPDKWVLVDVWATWCSPCKKEFGYNQQLHAFLEEKGIAMLYCSVDEPENSDNWRNNLSAFGLTGYHYYITSKAEKELLKIPDFRMLIPRYLLFDNKGKLVHANLPRPSSEKALYEEIEKLMQGN